MKTYTIKSNARRAARQQGLDPDTAVVACKGGFKVVAPASRLEPTKEQVRAEAEKQISAAADTADDLLDIPEGLRRPMPAGDELVAYQNRLDQIAKLGSPDRPLVLRTVETAVTDTKERKPRKIDGVLAKAQTEDGITVAEVHQMTGWTKIGGFYTALKKSGLVVSKKREGKVTTYFARKAA